VFGKLRDYREVVGSCVFRESRFEGEVLMFWAGVVGVASNLN
jgi:putative hemolysin